MSLNFGGIGNKNRDTSSYFISGIIMTTSGGSSYIPTGAVINPTNNGSFMIIGKNCRVAKLTTSVATNAISNGSVRIYIFANGAETTMKTNYAAGETGFKFDEQHEVELGELSTLAIGIAFTGVPAAITEVAWCLTIEE